MRIRTIEFDWEIPLLLEEEERERQYKLRLLQKEAAEGLDRYEEMRRILKRKELPMRSRSPSGPLQMVSPFALDD